MKKSFLLLSIFVCLDVFFVNMFFAMAYAKDFVAQRPNVGSMIVVESTTGKILKEENSQLRMPMASLTKVATAIVAIENCQDLDAKLQIPSQAVGIEGSSIYLVAGEHLSMRELLYGLMLRSGNDAAEAIAILTCNDTQAFVQKMNELCTKLELVDTNFCNPSGLHDENHYTTAYDFAMICSYARQNETFCQIVGTKKVSISNETQDYPRVLINKNKLLTTYPHANGLKTGYTKNSGRCLASSATKDGINLVCIVLNTQDMWQKSVDAMEWCFENFENKEILQGGLIENKIAVENGEKDSCDLAVGKSFFATLKRGEQNEYSVVFEIPEKLFAPIKANQKVGKAKVFLKDSLQFSTDVFAVENIEKKGIISKESEGGKVLENWSALQIEG